MDISSGLEWLLVALVMFALCCAGYGFYSLARTGMVEGRHPADADQFFFE